MSEPSGRDRAEARVDRKASEAELEAATPPMTGGREVRVGAFVLLGIFSFLMILFLLTDPATFRGRYMIVTEVNNAAGIRQGDPVQMRGVNIGRVHRFELAPEGVAITLEIEGRWEIPRDSRARIAGMDLMGGRTMEVLRGESEEMLGSGESIPGVWTPGMLDLADELGGDARSTMDDARSTMERIQALLSDPTVSAVEGSVSELEELLEVLTAATREQRSELARLSQSLSRSAERVEDLTGREELHRSLARADSTLVELHEAGGNLARATRSLELVLERVERGEGTLGRLSEDGELYETMNSAMEEIRLLARDVRDNPDRYIRLRIF